MFQDLGLSSMGLEHIEDGAFCNLHQMSTLNLNENELQVPPELCLLKCCLETLLLSRNNISNLSKNFFEGFKTLKCLHLSDNKLTMLPDLHWIKHSLRDIRAPDNKLKSLDELKTTRTFEMLAYIDMSRNYIRIFDVATLRFMPKLRVIILLDNKLSHIDDFRIYYTKAIYLVGNPWHCGMAMSWMGEDDMKFEDRLACETPACLQGIAIADMSKQCIYDMI